HALDVADVVGELLDEEPLAVRPAAAAEIAGVHAKAVRDELLGRPSVVAAVRIESVDDNDNGPGGRRRTPRSYEDVEPALSLYRFFAYSCRGRWWCHESLLPGKRYRVWRCLRR